MQTVLLKGKTKEEFLREEVQFWMTTLMRQVQWGLTLMVSLQTALVFVRRELFNSLVASGSIKPGSELPYHRYLIGTFFLGVAATILWLLTKRCAFQYRSYKKQLLELKDSCIIDQSSSGFDKWIGIFYFAFPILDFFFKFYIEFTGVKLH